MKKLFVILLFTALLNVQLQAHEHINFGVDPAEEASASHPHYPTEHSQEKKEFLILS